MDLEKPARRGRAAVKCRLLGLGVVVAVVVAACGGSSTPTTTSKKQTSHNKVSTGQPKTTAVSAPKTTTASAVATSPSASKVTFASTENCTSLSGVGEQFAKAMSSATSGGSSI